MRKRIPDPSDNSSSEDKNNVDEDGIAWQAYLQTQYNFLKRENVSSLISSLSIVHCDSNLLDETLGEIVPKCCRIAGESIGG